MEESSFLLLLLLLAPGLTPGPWGRIPTIRDRRTGTVHVLPFPASFSSKPIPLLPPPPSSPRERWARKVHRKRERERRARFGKLRRQKKTLPLICGRRRRPREEGGRGGSGSRGVGGPTLVSSPLDLIITGVRKVLFGSKGMTGETVSALVSE